MLLGCPVLFSLVLTLSPYHQQPDAKVRYLLWLNSVVGGVLAHRYCSKPNKVCCIFYTNKKCFTVLWQLPPHQQSHVLCILMRKSTMHMLGTRGCLPLISTWGTPSKRVIQQAMCIFLHSRGKVLSRSILQVMAK